MSKSETNSSSTPSPPLTEHNGAKGHESSLNGTNSVERADERTNTSSPDAGRLESPAWPSLDPRHRRLLRCITVVLLGVLFLEWFMISRRRPPLIKLERGSTFQGTYAIDINTANWVEWSQLEGIGPGLAHRIIAYRKVQGGFRSVEDLLQVPGIGQSKLDVIKPRLTIRYEQSESPYVRNPRHSSPDASVEAKQPSAIR